MKTMGPHGWDVRAISFTEHFVEVSTIDNHRLKNTSAIVASTLGFYYRVLAASSPDFTWTEPLTVGLAQALQESPFSPPADSSSHMLIPSLTGSSK